MLGVWAFHGAKDSTVPLSESERMVEALKKAGGTDVQLTVYPEAQHDSWTETYNNPDLYEWFLKHVRK
jgi:dipeptidyl aminopeptidase/acylaminoacyl peptidase